MWEDLKFIIWKSKFNRIWKPLENHQRLTSQLIQRKKSFRTHSFFKPIFFFALTKKAKRNWKEENVKMFQDSFGERVKNWANCGSLNPFYLLRNLKLFLWWLKFYWNLRSSESWNQSLSKALYILRHLILIPLN